MTPRLSSSGTDGTCPPAGPVTPICSHTASAICWEKLPKGTGITTARTARAVSAQMTSSSLSFTLAGLPDHRADIFPALTSGPPAGRADLAAAMMLAGSRPVSASPGPAGTRRRLDLCVVVWALGRPGLTTFGDWATC
jgi:hypothetical protein